ncbi:MAG TPA: tripartite tricarboxylate transporter TctB family protein [Streptosporangiaceae bacterium]|jgi:hypothetical protein
MGRLRGERILCGVLAAGGLAMTIASFGYHLFGAGGRIGPGFMPFCAGLALACFAVWTLAESFVRSAREKAAGTPSDAADTSAGAAPAGERPASSGSERRVVLVFVLTAASFALSFVTGFLVAFGLLICALLWFVEREKPWLAVGIGAVATLGSWAVFVLVLQVPLPGGMLGLLGGA